MKHKYTLLDARFPSENTRLFRVLDLIYRSIAVWIYLFIYLFNKCELKRLFRYYSFVFVFDTKKVIETEKTLPNFFCSSRINPFGNGIELAYFLFHSYIITESVWKCEFKMNHKTCGTREFRSTIIKFVVVKVIWITIGSFVCWVLIFKLVRLD